VDDGHREAERTITEKTTQETQETEKTEKQENTLTPNIGI